MTDMLPSERMFTFSTSSGKPTFRVRCHNCSWTVSGEATNIDGEWINAVFPQADEHFCEAYEHFWSKVNKNGPIPVHRPDLGPCWVWMWGTDTAGYGRFAVRRQPITAHKFSYVASLGPVPRGLEIDHLCRNRRCVNPSHFEAVTHAENIRRSTRWAAGAPRPTHCRNGHEYTPENTLESSNGHRRCRTCRAASEARASAKRAAGVIEPEDDAQASGEHRTLRP